MSSTPTITVIQLGKIGDLFHSLPAIRGLRHKNPSAHLRVICRRPFARFIQSESSIDEVVMFDHHQWLIPLMDPKTTWTREQFLKHTNELREWIESIRREDDSVVNLTFTEVSGVIAGLLSNVVLGMSFAEQQVVLADRWSQYFLSTVLRTGVNRFHLCDIYRAVSGVLDVAATTEFGKNLGLQQIGHSILSSVGIDARTAPPIVFHWGIEVGQVSWTDEEVVRFLSKLEKLNAYTNLVVTLEDNDRGQVEILKSAVPGIKVLTGLPDLYAYLGVFSCAKLVIGEGLGPTQLAVGAATPTLTLLHSRARYWEAGPCEPGHWILRGMNSRVESDVAARVAEALPKVTHEVAATLIKNDFKHRLYTSRKDGHGLNQFRQLSGEREDSVEGWFIYTYNSLRLEEMEGRAQPPSEIQPSASTMSLGILGVLLQALEKSFDLANIGCQYGELLKKEWKRDDKSLEEIKTLGVRLRDVDATLKTLSQAIPHLVPMIDDFEVEQLCLPLADAYQTVCMGIEAYVKLRNRFGVMYERIKSLTARIQSMVYGPKGPTTPPSKPPPDIMDVVGRFKIIEFGA